MKGGRRRGQRWRNAQVVVPPGNNGVRLAQMPLPLPPRLGLQNCRHHRPQHPRRRQPRKTTAKPFRIGRVLLLLQKTKPHQVLHQARGNDRGTGFVPDNAGTPHKRLLLPNPLPLRRHQVPPHLVRVVRQVRLQGSQLPQAIVKNAPPRQRGQLLLRDQQPIQQRRRQW